MNGDLCSSISSASFLKMILFCHFPLMASFSQGSLCPIRSWLCLLETPNPFPIKYRLLMPLSAIFFPSVVKPPSDIRPLIRLKYHRGGGGSNGPPLYIYDSISHSFDLTINTSVFFSKFEKWIPNTLPWQLFRAVLFRANSKKNKIYTQTENLYYITLISFNIIL